MSVDEAATEVRLSVTGVEDGIKACADTQEIVLEQPLGARRVIDGVTGESVPLAESA